MSRHETTPRLGRLLHHGGQQFSEVELYGALMYGDNAECRAVSRHVGHQRRHGRRARGIEKDVGGGANAAHACGRAIAVQLHQACSNILFRRVDDGVGTDLQGLLQTRGDDVHDDDVRHAASAVSQHRTKADRPAPNTTTLSPSLGLVRLTASSKKLRLARPPHRPWRTGSRCAVRRCPPRGVS